MRLSFDDEESFKEAVTTGLGSLRFNNPPSDPDSLQGVESSMLPPQETRRNEDNCFDNPSSDPNIILEVRRVPVGSSSSGAKKTDLEYTVTN